jgi:putative membrane protein
MVAGVVASFAMDRFQAAVAALTASDDDGDEQSEPATQKAADAVSTALIGREVPAADKPLAGQAIHYALGVGLGVAYGIAAEFRPAIASGYGVGFGIGTATLLDEAAVPAVGLGAAPWRSDLPTTLYGYVSHIVFGGAAELVRRQVRTTLLT